jgi:predicted RNA-binding protein with PIN domain
MQGCVSLSYKGSWSNVIELLDVEGKVGRHSNEYTVHYAPLEGRKISVVFDDQEKVGLVLEIYNQEGNLVLYEETSDTNDFNVTKNFHPVNEKGALRVIVKNSTKRAEQVPYHIMIRVK